MVRKLARKLLDRYPSRFTEDFEMNKKLIAELTSLESKKVRNRLARLVIKEIAQSKKLLAKNRNQRKEHSKPKMS